MVGTEGVPGNPRNVYVDYTCNCFLDTNKCKFSKDSRPYNEIDYKAEILEFFRNYGFENSYAGDNVYKLTHRNSDVILTLNVDYGKGRSQPPMPDRVYCLSVSNGNPGSFSTYVPELTITEQVVCGWTLPKDKLMKIINFVLPESK